MRTSIEVPAGRQPLARATVPERPLLESNVALVSEVRDSGFADRQWLIQRAGQFIQVTELLYRIAERMDGTRTLDEIAAEVTAATEWHITAEQARYLAETRLAPLGIIATADPGARSPTRAIARRRSPSPLALNMRRRVLAPHFIDPVTSLLHHLYRPRVLATMLVAVVLAHEWLYLGHGIGRGVQALLDKPVLLFPVLAIMPLAALVHEFGHASALRYGGGQVRGMGVGFYLIYPAFYTDVTDAYRLGRWARIRTDLGGLYFTLIFALVLIALYQLTGREFLLLAVLLIDLDTVYQLLPFVRLDGYWAFADLIGIPDPLSQSGAFLRSVAPQRLPDGNQLPRLKRRVRIAFVAYLLAAIPVLVLLTFLAVTRLPRMLAAEWHALARHAAVAAAAQAHGELGLLLMSTVYVLVLALLLLGTSYLLYAIVRAPVGALWRASHRPRLPAGAGAL